MALGQCVHQPGVKFGQTCRVQRVVFDSTLAPHNIVNTGLISLSDESFAAGNRSGAPTPDAARKLSSRRHLNQYFDACLEKSLVLAKRYFEDKDKADTNETLREHRKLWGFIQHLSFVPFSLGLSTEGTIRLYHRLALESRKRSTTHPIVYTLGGL
jgi:hypothetical protein